MSVHSIILLSVLGVILAVLTALLLYFICSPMPVVRLLRRGMGDCLRFPPDYEEKQKIVQIQKDIPYASDYGKNTLDLYLPKTDDEHPFILWVHGGAFVAGNKSGVENWGVLLAAAGYATAVMNYEWAPEAAYPAQIIQVTDALRTVSAFAAEKGIDMQHVVIAGDSAGAHMASQFALLHTNKNFAERLGIASPLSENALKGALLYCGPYDLKAMFTVKNRILRLFISRIGWSYLGKKQWKKSPLADTLTPMDFISAQYVPCYITDGNTGSFESHGKALGEALRKQGVEVTERYFDSADSEVNHEYQMQLDTENAQLCFADTLDFLKKHTGA